jgi:hypothetical protein
MIAGIDVNEKDIVIAYFSNIPNNRKPKFERINNKAKRCFIKIKLL